MAVCVISLLGLNWVFVIKGLVRIELVPFFHTVFTVVISSGLQGLELVIVLHIRGVGLLNSGLSLGKIRNFSLQTVNSQGLRCGKFQDSLNMNNDLVEVRVVVLELLESLLLVNLQDLLFDPNSGTIILLSFLPQVLTDHLLEGWLRLDGSNVSQLSNDHVFKNILQFLSLRVVIHHMRHV